MERARAFFNGCALVIDLYFFWISMMQQQLKRREFITLLGGCRRGRSRRGRLTTEAGTGAPF